MESEEDKALMRKVAAESIVLLKNENKLLPLDPKKLKKVAIVGGNAKATIVSGGGSAALKPSFFVSPYEGIEEVLKAEGVEVTYSEGARSTSIHNPHSGSTIDHCSSLHEPAHSRTRVVHC